MRVDEEFLNIAKEETPSDIESIIKYVEGLDSKGFIISSEGIKRLKTYLEIVISSYRLSQPEEKSNLRELIVNCNNVLEKCNIDEIERKKLRRELNKFQVMHTTVTSAPRKKVKKIYELTISIKSDEEREQHINIIKKIKGKEIEFISKTLITILKKLIARQLKKEELEIEADTKNGHDLLFLVSYKESQEEANYRESKELEKIRSEGIKLWTGKLEEFNKRMKRKELER